jgi:iron complex outermembrane receptor protein
MSELMNLSRRPYNLRRRLLVTVSVLALAGTRHYTSVVSAQEADRPTVWIELGGQLERSSGRPDPFVPAFAAPIPNSFFSATDNQRPPLYSVGGEGAISFEPRGTEWVVSASLRFGRSNRSRNLHQQTPNALVTAHVPSLAGFGLPTDALGTKYPDKHVKFEDEKIQQSDTHAVVDFQVGKEVGIGMLGHDRSSVLSAGIRFADFTSKANVQLHADPDVHYPSAPIHSIAAFAAFRYASIDFHDEAGSFVVQRSFRGVGPSVAWNASLPLVGGDDRGEVAIDWGANASVLFGRQKASGGHKTTVLGYHFSSWKTHGGAVRGSVREGQFINVPLFDQNGGVQHAHYTQSASATAHYHKSGNINRMRTVTVPNLGAVAAISFRYANAKVQFGYRADFFFGAMDGGVDVRKSESIGFHGPFATVSIGLGG